MMMTLTKKTYHYITDPEKLDSVVNEIYYVKNQLNPNSKIKLAIDFETYWSDENYKTDHEEIPVFIKTLEGTTEGLPRILALGLDPYVLNKQYLIDCKKIPFEIITEKFKNLLENDSILIFQYGQYECSILASCFNIYPNKTRDVMVIAQKRWTGDKLLNDNSNASFSLSALYQRCIPESFFQTLTGFTPKGYEEHKKIQQKSDWSAEILEEAQLLYSSDDTRLIFYVYYALLEEWDRFQKRFKKSKSKEQINLECDIVIECALMKCLGLGVDQDYLKNELIPYLEKKKREAEDILAQIRECWIEIQGPLKCPKTNPHYESLCKLADFNSSKQCAKVLYENLGFKLPKTDKGNLSVAGNIVDELFWELPESKSKDILEKIIQYRTASSYLSSYGNNLFKHIHEDGRVHPTYYQLGTDTGRFSVKNPAIQTIPGQDLLFDEVQSHDLFRKLFISKPGYSIIDADFGNEEQRVIAEFSKDKEMISEFNRNGDLHQLSANNLGVPRGTAKTFNFAAQYGAFEKKIKKTLYQGSGGKVNLPLDTVKEYRIKHFEFYSGLRDEIQKCSDYIEKIFAKHDSLTDFVGRQEIVVGFTPVSGSHRIWCLTREQEIFAHYILKNNDKDKLRKDYRIYNEEREKWETWNNEFNSRKSSIIREYFNFLVQGECAVVLKLAIREIGKQFRRLGYDPFKEGIIAVIHDQILAEVRDDHIDEAKEIIYTSMYNALSTVITKMPVVISMSVGKSWAEAKH